MSRHSSDYVTATDVAAAVYRRHCSLGVDTASAFAAAVETYRRFAPRLSRREAARAIAAGLWAERAAPGGSDVCHTGSPTLPC
ncbi:hypothetical protein [Rhodospirillum centenum]|uniref:Uncharacterized protein n=1 Tax=Rhodospirillum centenum (strain ATCC 51521 / SW) TaxID=414684 RepID=B6IRM2_RHOCS|nr:hypothetical protein [Rhodospirillum centenum]ACI98108.1 hypothetical protein RC1_0673 [Rhodospirillum centenum SW]